MTAQLVKVVLLKPHTHSGTQYLTGSPLLVPLPDSRWLIQNMIARPDGGRKLHKQK